LATLNSILFVFGWGFGRLHHAAINLSIKTSILSEWLIVTGRLVARCLSTANKLKVIHRYPESAFLLPILSCPSVQLQATFHEDGFA
jgi:hypothetical protein